MSTEYVVDVALSEQQLADAIVTYLNKHKLAKLGRARVTINTRSEFGPSNIVMTVTLEPGPALPSPVPVREPIDTWLLAAPHRMVTLMVDRTQDEPAIVAMLDEGMLERGTGRGTFSAEANANALNNVMALRAREHGLT